MKHVHFIGIEGIGLSGAAKILLESGVHVSGSDLRPGNLARKLEKMGSVIYWGHAEKNIEESVDTVVASNAINEKNLEYMAAKNRCIPILRYPELLGVLMTGKPIGIAVAGTHGKTTTSGLVSYVFEYSREYPSFIIGGYIHQLNGNAKKGAGKHFITEACEYQRSFLYLAPKIGVITNIEKDHLDYYSNINDIRRAYIQFAENIPADGVLIIEKKAWEKIKDDVHCQVLTYGLNEKADFSGKIRDITPTYSHFAVKIRNDVHSLVTPLCGRYNIENCIAGFAVADAAGIPIDKAIKAIAQYNGVCRRFEVLQEKPFVIVNDYAHHPTEIVSVLEAARERYQGAKIWCIFQPHQANRTYHLLKGFASSFYDADEIIVSDIFYARDSEQDRSRISSQQLVQELRNNGKSACHISRFDSIKRFLIPKVANGDVLLFLGAGNIDSLAHNLTDFS
ncbi:UDP-N-acetylmuramate--L-alanine ligase [Candidatus Uabimicrobium sp. HlEnr_7]|uniref:UDP-N-acetylmuramate--L-alanine ligase n=1 Tax=Candidatus Uabimicrobium helgolandensis TaxID=3095367 RepID=UPI00355737CF